MMNYYVMLADDSLEDMAVITEHPEGLEVKGFEFSRAKPLCERMSGVPIYSIDDSKPSEWRVLYPYVRNTMRLAIISQEIKGILDGSKGEIEFIPIRIQDRKRKLIEARYFIAHSLTEVDAINLDSSEYEFSSLVKERFTDWDKIDLKVEQIDPSLEIFSLRYMGSFLFINESLKAKIETVDHTGLRFVAVDDFAAWDIS